jgi:hypothetical protein
LARALCAFGAIASERRAAMNSRYVENLQDGIEERSTLMAKKFREQFEGMGPGMKDTRGDREFLAWFFYMGSQYGVDWVRALEFVDGGKDLLRRFIRLSNEGVIRGEAV